VDEGNQDKRANSIKVRGITSLPDSLTAHPKPSR
jgi:hypothetical protein